MHTTDMSQILKKVTDDNYQWAYSIIVVWSYFTFLTMYNDSPKDPYTNWYAENVSKPKYDAAT